jgi:L-seryl-tRNA(Ser) seleniumtransferase
MTISEHQKKILQQLPGVDHILELAAKGSDFVQVPRTVLTRSIRTVLEELRKLIIDNTCQLSDTDLADDVIVAKVKTSVSRAMALNLERLVNATGVVIHTNLGRSLLATEALENLQAIGGRYSNLEFDLARGKRGSRYSNVEDIICEITGAEAAMVVNNNAGAVLLCLETVAKGRKVIVSRGELVEIGGSFRIPDVMAKSGGILTEVGTTNRTHLKDYENAIDEDTALLLKVHKSNYSIVGFTKEVALLELVELSATHHLPVMEDLGSGTFIDFSRYGLEKETTVQESVATGADIVTFSGDKLLGATQAGFIVGKRQYLDRIKQNPITRALRIDKLSLAALESTLRLYRDEEKAVNSIPTLRMLVQSVDSIEKKARRLKNLLIKIDRSRLKIDVLKSSSKAGGGSLPLLELPSRCLAIKINGISANTIEAHLRNYSPPIIGRIEENNYILDPRTIQDDELAIIKSAFEHLLIKD